MFQGKRAQKLKTCVWCLFLIWFYLFLFLFKVLEINDIQGRFVTKGEIKVLSPDGSVVLPDGAKQVCYSFFYDLNL